MTDATVLRRDAMINRERILEAARSLFAEQGLDVGMDDVARSAGVGAGTLYRRFPNKGALIDAILLDVLHRYVAFAEEAAEQPDAFSGLEWFLEQAIRLQLANQAFLEIMLVKLSDEPQLAEVRTRSRPPIEKLVTRAQEQGTLRADVTATDVTVLIWQLGRVVESLGSVAPNLWRRYLALTLDGLRAEAARPLEQPAPTRRQLELCMSKAAGRRLHRGRQKS